MAGYEYRILPAPSRGRKARGVRTPEARFARAVEDLLNEMARDGWRYIRSDTLPDQERRGLIATATVHRVVLVFERALPPAPEPGIPRAEEVVRSLIADHPEHGPSRA